MLIFYMSIESHAQTLSTLANFNGTNGSEPMATLTLDGNGNLYGTTRGGGNLYGVGTVFKLTTNGTLTTVVSFDGTNGANPQQPLILLNNTLYGTAGSYFGGTIFSVNTDGSYFTNFFNFDPDPLYGSGVYGPIGILLSSNTFYGTTSEGGIAYGASGDGGIFSINANGANFTTLFGFDGIDGGESQGSLILSGNTLYGVCGLGGSWGAGTVFAINTDGTSFTNLCSFTGSDGISPQAGLILSGNTLYGTASRGGYYNAGTIFSVNTDGTDFKTLYNFTGRNDGSGLSCSLLLLGNTLYGTAPYGGSNNNGTVFEINTNGTAFKVLHAFMAKSPLGSTFGTNSDGASPAGGLILSGNTLYGTAMYGGAYGEGTVFALSMPIPTLGINTFSNQIILTWPTSAANFRLLTSPDLLNWNTATNGITIVGSNYTFTNSMNGHAEFFRLQTQ
jgi:uncharacterized repeat protein (TIGR03803 family)